VPGHRRNRLHKRPSAFDRAGGLAWWRFVLRCREQALDFGLGLECQGLLPLGIFKHALIVALEALDCLCVLFLHVLDDADQPLSLG
jgi:hypothetical protein